jgi:hypothetical protein
MVNQTLTKPIGLIQDLKIHIHGIPYVVTLIVMQNNVLDTNYSMLLNCPWLQDAKVTHDWGNNLISIEGNGTVRTITITKHLDSNTKHPEVLFYYEFVNEVIDEEEDMLLAAEPDLFAINTITLLELEVLAVMSDAKTSTNTKTGNDAKIDIDAKINIDEKIDIDMEINIDTKTNIYLKFCIDESIFYFPHTQGEISIDITLVQIKVQDMKMVKWNLEKDVQICPRVFMTNCKW